MDDFMAPAMSFVSDSLADAVSYGIAMTPLVTYGVHWLTNGHGILSGDLMGAGIAAAGAGGSAYLAGMISGTSMQGGLMDYGIIAGLSGAGYFLGAQVFSGFSIDSIHLIDGPRGGVIGAAAGYAYMLSDEPAARALAITVGITALLSIPLMQLSSQWMGSMAGLTTAATTGALTAGVWYGLMTMMGPGTSMKEAGLAGAGVAAAMILMNSIDLGIPPSVLAPLGLLVGIKAGQYL